MNVKSNFEEVGFLHSKPVHDFRNNWIRIVPHKISINFTFASKLSLFLNMHYSPKQLLILFSVVCIGTIGAILIFKSKEVIPQKGVYFWESGRSSMTNNEMDFLSEHEIQKMYVKFFEIEKNGNSAALPISKTQLTFIEANAKGIEIIPTVYIKNEVFKKCSESQLDKLAENVYFLIEKKFSEQFSDLKVQFNEIQIDCDWTISTQENYFSFLEKFKEMGKFTLSATLRLYPYKFPHKMGILPVDRAMLMCYNLISPLDAGSRNSILDLHELEKYLYGANEYPVPLDLALPIYSSALIVQNNQFTAIHYGDNARLKESLTLKKEPWYFSKVDSVLPNLYLRKGDKVKLETISAERVREALKIIRRNITFKQGMTLSLFHLQNNQIQQFNYAEVSSFYRTLSPL